MPLIKKKIEEKIQTYQPDVGEESRRVRVIESQMRDLARKVELIENNLVQSNRKQNSELKTLGNETTEIRRDIASIKDKFLLFINEFKLTARSEDVEVIRKYLDYWKPADFVTRKELKKILMEKGEEDAPVRKVRAKE